jgi:hypothetical protein
MGLLHYNSAPAVSDAALVTASVTTVVAHVVAVNPTPLAATVSLSVHRSLSGETETFAASQALAPLSAAELVYDPSEALGEIVLNPNDTLHGSATGTGPAAPVPTNAATGGTVLAGVYGVKVTYVSAAGETVASAAGTTTTSGTTSTLTIPSPAANANATGWYAYVTQVGGSTYTRQQAAGSPTAIGTGLTLTAPPTSTGAQPSATSGVTVIAFE